MFFISTPLVHLLAKLEFSAERLNHTFDIRFRHRLGQMGLLDHIPRKLSRAGGTAVTRLRRLNRYILLETNCYGVRYSETSRDNCTLICPGSLPATIEVAVKGLAIGRVVDLGPVHNIFSTLIIRSTFDAWQGAIGFNLEPAWQRHN